MESQAASHTSSPKLDYRPFDDIRDGTTDLVAHGFAWREDEVESRANGRCWHLICRSSVVQAAPPRHGRRPRTLNRSGLSPMAYSAAAWRHKPTYKQTQPCNLSGYDSLTSNPFASFRSAVSNPSANLP